MMYFGMVEVGEDWHARPDFADTEVAQMVLDEIVLQGCILSGVLFLQLLGQVILKVIVKGKVHNWHNLDAKVLLKFL